MLTNILSAKGSRWIYLMISSHPLPALFPSRASNPVEPYKHSSRATQALFLFRTSIPVQCGILFGA